MVYSGAGALDPDAGGSLDDPISWRQGALSNLNNGYYTAEEQRIVDGLERRVARSLGEPTRTNHWGYALPSGRDFSTIRVVDPTAHAPGRDFD